MDSFRDNMNRRKIEIEIESELLNLIWDHVKRHATQDTRVKEINIFIIKSLQQVFYSISIKYKKLLLTVDYTNLNC